MSPRSNIIVASLDQPIMRQVVATCVLGLCSWVIARTVLALEAERDSARQSPKKGVFSRLRIAARQFTEAERELVEQALLLPDDVVCVSQEDLVGPVMMEVMRRTRHLVQMSLHVPVSNRESVISQSRGLLLHGPPGTGKTTVAKVRPSIFYQMIRILLTPKRPILRQIKI